MNISALLTTKLHPPPVRSHLVARARLTALLDEARPLTFISATPGFGKTTLLSEWIAGQEQTATAWLSLDADDNDPPRFLAYLAAALNRALPGAGEVAQALMAAPQQADQRAIITALINALNTASRDVVLVLDDYHVIQTQAIHDTVTFLLEHRPLRLRLCITTRADPPLPLSRLRARGDLQEIRVNSLRFTHKEAARFLENVMGIRLTAESLAALSARTEGWIAGLQLAALSMQGRDDVPGFVRAFAGSNAYIVDYLADEVLRQQLAHIEQFLLQTSILNQLNGSLCDAVTERTDSTSILEGLERSNLFVVPLDADRQWYRYHHLFRDVLQHRLKCGQSDVSALHRRACDWHERHNNVAESVNHALAAGDMDRAARLIETWEASLGQSGRIRQELDWFAVLPEEVVRNSPDLCVIHAGLLAHVGQPDAAEARMQDAERRLQDQHRIPIEHASMLHGRMAGIRAEIARSRGEFARCVALARQALALLPEAEVLARQRLSMYVLLDFLLTGNVSADAATRQAQLAESARTSDSLVSHMSGITTLGWMRLYRGELHKAVATFEQAMAGWEAIGLEGLGLSIFCRLGLADILREWDRWEEAEVHLTRGLAVIDESATPDANLVWLVAHFLTRLKQAQGDFVGAAETLERLIDVARAHHIGELTELRLTAVKAWLWLAMGDVTAAHSWAMASGLREDDAQTADFQRETEYLILIRVWIAHARTEPDERGGPDKAAIHKALTLLDRMLPAAESSSRVKSVIEMRMLRALALQARNDARGASAALGRSLELAEPEGYVRLFVDEGEPMRHLLHRLDSADARVRNYRDQLLAAFERRADNKPMIAAVATNAVIRSGEPVTKNLVKPLNKRELEVLHCIGEGLSNREIAAQFYVSQSTVKWYINNLYGKLGVASRTQALARAKALGLI